MDTPTRQWNPEQGHLIRRVVTAMPMARLMGVNFLNIEAGKVELEIPYKGELSYRPCQLQSSAIFAAADFAAMSAAGTLLPPKWMNATIDCSLKLFAPANGTRLLARGRVVSASKLLTIAAADVYSMREDRET